MSGLAYKFMYRVGLAPWEDVGEQESQTVSEVFERAEAGREPPYGRALDLGCGSGVWSVQLAQRGWAVTGIELVPKALRRAHERAQEAGVGVRFVHGDVSAFGAADVGSDFGLLLDIGCFHGLSDPQREAMGRGVTAVAASDATLLMFAFTPGRRGPLPRGASRQDIEAAFPEWNVTDELPFDPSELPRPVRNAAPRYYRLARAAAATA